MGAAAVAAAVATLSLALAAAPARGAGGRSIPELFESSFALEATGQYARALEAVEAILRQRPDDYVANLRAGWLSYLLGAHDKAVRFYEKASDVEPKAIEPRLGLMLPLMAARQWARAAEVARRILEVDPRNYLARSRLAWVAYSQGRYGQAERTYAEVLRDYPGDVDMMLGLAWTYLKQGRKDDARRTFERVLRIRRNNESARAGLAELDQGGTTP